MTSQHASEQKARRNAGRRERYLTDPEYRRECNEASRVCNARRRQNQKQITRGMRLYTTEEQAQRLEAVGINSNKCRDIGTLMDALCAPCEGETVYIRTGCCDKDYSIDYDNAGDARFSDHDTDLVELLVRFAEWKAPKWRINEKYYSSHRG